VPSSKFQDSSPKALKNEEEKCRAGGRKISRKERG